MCKEDDEFEGDDMAVTMSRDDQSHKRTIRHISPNEGFRKTRNFTFKYVLYYDYSTSTSTTKVI